ncbi:MAG: hypothetical protein ACK4N5_13545 [Myxococcales bacterium]
MAKVARALTAPGGVALPLPYRWTMALGMTRLPPWHFLGTARQAQALRKEFLLEIAPPNRCPIKDWMPFARREDTDDVAGFVLEKGKPSGAVAVVHLTWRGAAEQPGWPSLERYEDFWAWLRKDALESTRQWASEPALKELLSGAERGPKEEEAEE